MKCGNCTTTNLAGSRFCSECGLPLDKACASCGEMARSHARFCSQCGASFSGMAPGPELQPNEGELKQVTVLFADMRGSTYLIQSLDPEAAMAELDAGTRLMAEAVERFGGVVNKQQGDGIMALFGVPNACEDHAVRACFAGRAIVDGVVGLNNPAIAVRVGLGSGSVVVRPTGSDASDFDAIGLTVHIAARMEQLAEPGTVQLDGQTALLARSHAAVAALPPATVRGIPDPVETYRLLSISERPSWDVLAATNTLNRFVGRDTELLQLQAALRRAGLGRGQVVALVGDAGLGKSRLLHEFLRLAPIGGWNVLQVSATSQTRGATFHLAADLLRSAAVVNSSDGPADIARKLANLLAALPGDPPLDTDPLRWLLDLGVQDSAWQSMEVSARRARVIAALRWALLRATERRPLLIVVEDYHWADDASIEALSAVVDGMGGTRMLMLVTSRPDLRPPWSSRSYVTEIELMPLEPASAEALLCGLLGASDNLATLRAQIVSQADGTPLFLEEIARSLLESGVVLTRPAHATVTQAVSEVQIPASVQAILAARIDRLPVARRRLLQLAAVIGKDVPLRLLAAVSDLSEDVLAGELLELQMAEFLYECNFALGREYTFKHILTQTVAYESMLRRQRHKLHRGVLKAIETIYADRIDEWTERLAAHALAGEAWEAAAGYALKAAERANRSCAWHDAVRLLESAVGALAKLPQTPATTQQSIDVRLQLRVALAALSDLPRLRSVLVEARALEQASGDPLRLARIDISRCLNLTMMGELDEAIEAGRAAYDTWQATGEPGGIVSSGFALGQAYFFRGKLAQALQIFERGYRHAENGYALQNTGTTGTAAVLYLTCLMRTHVLQGNLHAATRVNMHARRVAEALQRPFDLAELGQAEGTLHLAAGQTEKAVAVLQDSLALARSSKSTLLLPIIASALGRALAETGELDAAERLLEEALEQTGRHGYLAMHIHCGPAYGMVRTRRSPELGRAEYLSGLARARAHGFRPVEVQILRLLGDLATAHGGGDPAHYYAEASALAAQLGMAPESGAPESGAPEPGAAQAGRDGKRTALQVG